MRRRKTGLLLSGISVPRVSMVRNPVHSFTESLSDSTRTSYNFGLSGDHSVGLAGSSPTHPGQIANSVTSYRASPSVRLPPASKAISTEFPRRAPQKPHRAVGYLAGSVVILKSVRHGARR